MTKRMIAVCCLAVAFFPAFPAFADHKKPPAAVEPAKPTDLDGLILWCRWKLHPLRCNPVQQPDNSVVWYCPRNFIVEASQCAHNGGKID